MANKVVIVIVVVAVLIVAAIGGGVFFMVILPKLTDDDDGGGGNGTGGGDGGGGGNNQNPIPVILVLDSTKNLSVNREFAVDEIIWFDATGSQGNISRFQWDFGDGITRDGPGEDYAEVNHSYNERGIYTVNLTVIGSNGARGKTNVTVTILGDPYTDSQTELLSTRIGTSNSTYSFPVEEDARNVTVSISATGFSQDITAVLIVEVYNPYHDLMDNETLRFVLSSTHDFYFQPSQISVTGNYFVELSCQAGTVRVIIDVYVGY